MSQRPPALSEQIRQALDGCGFSRYAISKGTGVSQSTLSRFISGERGLPMKTLDKLAAFLDLRIVIGSADQAKTSSRRSDTSPPALERPESRAEQKKRTRR